MDNQFVLQLDDTTATLKCTNIKGQRY